MENKNYTPISNVIRTRIYQANKRFHCNDNISEFIKDGELEDLVDEVTDKFNDVLDPLIIVTGKQIGRAHV